MSDMPAAPNGRPNDTEPQDPLYGFEPVDPKAFGKALGYSGQKLTGQQAIKVIQQYRRMNGQLFTQHMSDVFREQRKQIHKAGKDVLKLDNITDARKQLEELEKISQLLTDLKGREEDRRITAESKGIEYPAAEREAFDDLYQKVAMRVASLSTQALRQWSGVSHQQFPDIVKKMKDPAPKGSAIGTMGTNGLMSRMAQSGPMQNLAGRLSPALPGHPGRNGNGNGNGTSAKPAATVKPQNGTTAPATRKPKLRWNSQTQQWEPM